MASVPKIKIELDVVETEELKKAIAKELEQLEGRTKAYIDEQAKVIINKYISKAEDGKDVEETDN